MSTFQGTDSKEFPGLSWIKIPPSLPETWKKKALSYLDPYEQERYKSYTHNEARVMFLMGRFFMRSKLAAQLTLSPSEVPIKLSEGGKPILEGIDYHFSLTHTAQWIGLYHSAKGPVGVDLETMKQRDFLKLANRFFSPDENDWLEENEERCSRFYRIWTQKEAFLKCTGQGLAGRLSHYTMPCVNSLESIDGHIIRNFFPAPGITGAVTLPE